MNRQEYLFDIIKATAVTDKSRRLNISNNVLVLKVSPKATKKDIKEAVELALSLEVESVTTLNVIGKTKRIKYGTSKRQDWKKAFVKLKPSNSINDLAENLGSAADGLEQVSE